jgi:hypothetical protein
MSNKEQTHSKPPTAPEITRRVQLNRLQMIGIPLIILIPLLALLGLFGETIASASDANAELELHVTYPTRFRYKMIDQANVSVRNLSQESLPAVTVYFDRDYIDSFSTVTFTPDVKSITDVAYIVELSDLQPQETRIVSVQLQAEKYWRHEGEIMATFTETIGAEVSLRTFVFP